MKIKVRNHLAHLPILRKGGAHGMSKKAQRSLDKVSIKKQAHSALAKHDRDEL